MKAILKRYGALAVVVLFVVVSIWKTMNEVQKRTEDAWKGESSTAWVEKTAEWNPTLRLPHPTDIAEKREPVRAVREPARYVEDSDLTASWRSDPADMVWTTRTGPTETGEQFAARARHDLTAMLLAFPSKR